MRLLICNASPRGRQSNSKLLADAFAEGFCSVAGNSVEQFYVAENSDFERGVAAFGDAEAVLLAFPIYVDAMPGVAKAFIEALAPWRGRCGGTRMLFLIQTGFPEETHTRPMAAYLPKLAKRLGSPCDGVIRMGGGEGVRQQANSSRGRKRLDLYRQLGREYATRGVLDEGILAQLRGPRRIPGLLARLIFPFVNWFFWDKMLKANGAYEKRYDKPLA